MSNRIFVLYISIVFIFGLVIGYCLSGFQKLETYKLLNVTGLFYDFLGIVVLSEIATSHANWKKISIERVAPAVLWFHTILPLSVALSGGIRWLLAGSVTGAAISQFAVAFFFVHYHHCLS